MITKQLGREFAITDMTDLVEFLRRLITDLESHSHSFFKINNVAGAYTILDTDEILAVTTSSPAFTLTLPLAADAGKGKLFIITDVGGTGAGTDNITVARSGTDTIDTASSQAISANYGTLRLVSDGASKYITV